jgi:hypothetical protein
MKTHTIPPQKFDILLMFLPRFEEPGRTYLKGWQGRLPQYPDDVVAFFRWAKDGVWIDPGYDPKIASKLIQDDAYIAQATVDELRPFPAFWVKTMTSPGTSLARYKAAKASMWPILPIYFMR